MTTLPHRFSKRAFEKYEKVIADIAEKYPYPVKISPGAFGLSPETIRGRLRDACSSLKTHRWPTTRVNMALFDAIDHDQLSIVIRPDGMVFAGEKTKIKDTSVEANEVVDVISENEVFDCSTFMSAHSSNLLAILAHNGALKKHIKLFLTETEHKHLSSGYDIVLSPTNEPNIYILS